MTQTTIRAEIEACYPTPLIRGARIARLGEKYLGPVAADAATCRFLGEEQIGWFVGGVPTFDRMIEYAARINSSDVGGRWIVVPATRGLAEVAYQHWFEDETTPDDVKPATVWHDDLVTFCVPERLDGLGRAIVDQDVPVAGIILLDPNCIVHRGRGFGKGKFRVSHDRPQLVVNFRSKLAIGNWCPPLMVMSLRKAAAVSAQDATRVYGLDAMNFLDGVTLSCGAIKNQRSKIQPKPDRLQAVSLVTSRSIISTNHRGTQRAS